MRLEKLNDKLLEWGDSTERKAVVDRLRARTSEVCRSLPDGDEGRRNCETFLKPGKPATQHA